VKKIGEEFGSGRMSSGDIKQALIDVITPLVLQHQEARKKVTDEIVAQYMKIRPLTFKGAPKLN